MSDARRMGKSELFSHFAERFEVKRTQAREFFDELTALAEKELKRSGEFVLPGMVKLVVQKRKARMGRNPATGEAIKIPAKTVVKARIAKQLKDAVLPKKEVKPVGPHLLDVEHRESLVTSRRFSRLATWGVRLATCAATTTPPSRDPPAAGCRASPAPAASSSLPG